MYTRGDDTTLEATHVHTRMTIQATRARSRLAERGFSRPVAPRRARWFLVWTRAHNFSCGHRSPPWKPHAGRRRPIRDAARWQTGTCQHRRSLKRAHAQMQAPPRTPIICPAPRLKKRSADSIELLTSHNFQYRVLNNNVGENQGVKSTWIRFDGRPWARPSGWRQQHRSRWRWRSVTALTTACGSAFGAGASHDVHDATARSAQLCPLEGVCHGDWGEGMQNHLRCTLKDVLPGSTATSLPRSCRGHWVSGVSRLSLSDAANLLRAGCSRLSRIGGAGREVHS